MEPLDIHNIELDKVNTLPDTRLKIHKNVIKIGPSNWVPIFCANCGADGGRVPEENCSFAFYLCNPCAEKFPNLDGVYVEPDVVFWEKVRRAQIEEYGHELTYEETVKELDDESSILAKLAKDRPKLR